MKKINVLFIFIIIGLFNASCQTKKVDEEENNIDYKGIYETLFKEERYNELYEHLQEWEEKEANNPEMYIAYFNYYIIRERFSGISIDNEMKGGTTAIQINDPETGEIVGYINESVQYKNNDIIIAVEYLDKGLNIAPNRLDMHFGKIHILNEVGYYDDAGNELFKTLEISNEINNNWLWANNEMLENGEIFLLNNINDYYGFWLNANEEKALEQVKKCTEKQIELYPNSIYAYNILAIYYSIKNQPQETLKYFLLAETINPNDCIVLLNIGRSYLNMGNSQKAEEYLLKVINIGNQQEKETAEYYLNQLK